MARTSRGIIAILVLSFLAIFAGCYRKDTYRPIYYPNRYDLTVYSRGPSFDNLAQARQWAQDQHRQHGDADWDYEVGKNCKPFDRDSDIEMCRETLR